MDTLLHTLAPELHSEIIQYIDRDSILAMAVTSRTLNAVASRALYRRVKFDAETPASTIHLFLDRVSRPKGHTSLIVHLHLD